VGTATCLKANRAAELSRTVARSEHMQSAMAVSRGRIQVAAEGLLTVMTESGPLACRAAAGCLVRPESGDLALVVLPNSPKEMAYVLAVLERAQADSPMHIDLGAGARLESEKGCVEIAAGADLRLRAGAQLEASADSISFVSRAMHWLTHTFSLLGRTVEVVCSVWRESSRERETTAQTWTQRLGDCRRHVQDLDETQAGMSRTLARETALLHGRVTYVQAEELVKVDGGEVHLG
jgi:hypothetical protein